MMVELDAHVSFDPEEVGVTELVYYPVLSAILEKAGSDEELLKEAREEFEKRTADGFVCPIPADAVPVVPD